MLTLLQINTSLNRNSTGKIAEQIASLARTNGWDTYIIHGPRYVNKSDMHTLQTVTSFGEKLHALKSMLLGVHGLGSSCATKRIIREIIRIQPDIIHLHNIHGYYINYKVLFEYLNSVEIPIVWTLHDCWPITGHCTFFDSIDCERWKNGCYKCPLKNDYPKSIIFDRSKENYILKKNLFTSVKNVTIIPVSQWLGDIVKQSFLSKYPYKVIHNGIDISIFSPKQSNLRSELNINDKIIVLGVASIWHERKGLDDFVKLAELLPEVYCIILIGISLKQKEILPKNIITVSRTESQKDLAEYYSIADVYVNPTYSDNFPTTNLEAMACGTPVITYQTGGSPEAVTHETGLVVAKGDFDGLVNAIKEIRAKGKAYYTLSCRQRAIDFYNKNDRYQDYINLYNELLNEKSCSR